MGAVYRSVHKLDVKNIKVFAIILIMMMTIAGKIIAVFTISMGTLMFKCALIIYGWISTHMTLVTGGLIVVVKFRKIKFILL